MSGGQIDGTPFHIRSDRLWGEQLVVTPLSPTDGEWNAHLVRWGAELAKELGLNVNIPEGVWPLDGEGE